MEVILAQHAGFCFGVKRAVEILDGELAGGAGKRIYTWGPIIHNEAVVESYAARGVRAVDSLDELDRLLSETGEDADPGVLVIRSHGVSKAVFEGLEKRGLTVVDATCPFVKRIHRAVQEAAEQGRTVIVTGDPAHPEVEGIVGWAAYAPVYVVSTPEEAEKLALPVGTPVTVVSQTTFRVTKFQEIVEIIQEKEYDVNIVGTICNATEERQKEAQELSGRMDAMIVVGGAHSSNTRKLFEICSRICPQTSFIHTPEDLSGLSWPDEVRRVGITAGASTPQKIIEEVVNYVRSGQEFHGNGGRVVQDDPHG
ncbi:MAG: 4-hydroxy-3-methylbut-2-enyl diphosphate reductase [Lachnospiraceae bacterium]|nr:4-hydroxy-3-methylbut-2-enyl diphosphate reductase [Lachnospiraceae bacterium]